MPHITRITSSDLNLDISSRGAEMQALSTTDGKAFLWNGDERWWTGRAPLLFPIVGKAPGDKISIEGKTFEMGQHGFARRSEFRLVAADTATCRYELEASEDTRAQFPFEFLLSVSYALDGTKLSVSAEVENRDTKSMPFGFGFHPAFLWPLPDAADRLHTITLQNGAEPAMVRLKQGLVDPQRHSSPFHAGQLVLDPSLFEADAMIFPDGAGTNLTYSAAPGPALHFTFENLPNLALWQKPGAPFICIEPWHGTAANINGSNDLAARPYSTVLQPDQKVRFGFTVKIESKTIRHLAAFARPHGGRDGGAFSRPQWDDAGGKRLAGYDRRVWPYLDSEPGPRQDRPVQSVHDQRRFRRHSDAITEGLFATDDEGHVTRSSRSIGEQARKTAIVIEVAVAEHSGVYLVRGNAQQCQVIGQSLGRITEINQDATGLIAHFRRRQQRQAEFTPQGLFGHVAIGGYRRSAAVAIDVQARPIDIVKKRPERRGIDHHLNGQPIDFRRRKDRLGLS